MFFFDNGGYDLLTVPFKCFIIEGNVDTAITCYFLKLVSYNNQDETVVEAYAEDDNMILSFF